MRRSHLLIFAVLLAPCALHSQSRRVWEFEGIGVEEKVGCINNPTTRYGWTWIDKSDNVKFDSLRTALRDSLSKEYDGRARLTSYSVTSDKAVVIAVVKRHLLCGQYSGPPKMVDSYKFVFGSDEASIRQRLEKEVQTSTSKDLKGFDVIQWLKLEVKDMVAPPGSKPQRPVKLTTLGVRG